MTIIDPTKIELFRARVRALAGGDAVNWAERLRQLQEASRDLWADPQLSADGPHCVQPAGDPAPLWQDYEHLPFEAALQATGSRTGSAGMVIRGICKSSAPPVTICSDGLRVLVIAASPKDMPLAIASSEATAMVERAVGRAAFVEVKIISGDGTVDLLTEVVKKNQRWDIVHIVAHGTRANNGSVVLATGRGSEQNRLFDEFVEILAIHLRAPRLFTLAMCDSSPLAARIANRFAGVQVVGLLGETDERTVSRFFGAFYDELLGWTKPGREVEKEVSAHSAFAHAVSSLYLAKNPEWMLPVFYGPVRAQPLLDMTGYERIEQIETMARKNDLSGAREEAQGLEHARAARIAKWAAGIVREIAILECYEANLLALTVEVRQAASQNPVWEPFGRIHAAWHNRHFDKVIMVGPGAEAAGEPLPVLEILRKTQDIYDVWRDHALAAAKALAELGSTAGDWVNLLLDGCGKLKLFLQAKDPTPQEPATILHSVVCNRLLAIKDRLDEANGLTARREAIALARVMLTDLQRLVDEASRELLDTARAESLMTEHSNLCQLLDNLPVEEARRQVAAAGVTLTESADFGPRCDAIDAAITTVEDAEKVASERGHSPLSDLLVGECRTLRETIHRLFPPAPPDGGLPEELAKPGHRLDLLDRLRAPAAAAPATPPPRCRTTSPHCGACSTSGAKPPPGPSRLTRSPRVSSSAAANETAPIRLVATLDEAAHPYLLLHADGGAIDLPTDGFLRIETDVTGLAESPLKWRSRPR